MFAGSTSLFSDPVDKPGKSFSGYAHTNIILSIPVCHQWGGVADVSGQNKFSAEKLEALSVKKYNRNNLTQRVVGSRFSQTAGTG